MQKCQISINNLNITTCLAVAFKSIRWKFLQVSTFRLFFELQQKTKPILSKIVVQ